MSRQFIVRRPDAKILGVCAGIADYFGWDVSLVRIAFVVAAIFGVGSPVILYVAIGLVARLVG